MTEEQRVEAGGCGAQSRRREISAASAQVEPNASFFPFLVGLCLDLSIKQAETKKGDFPLC